jgi:hypothetical protein
MEILSIILGVLGGAFCWWTPLGIVLSVAGLVSGFVGWTVHRRVSPDVSLLITGMIVSAASLVLGCLIAGLGMEIFKVQSLQQ